MLKFIVHVPQSSLPALYAVPGIDIKTTIDAVPAAGAPAKPGRPAKPVKALSNVELASRKIKPFLIGMQNKAPVAMAAIVAVLKQAYPNMGDNDDVYRNAGANALKPMIAAGKVIVIGSGAHSSYMWNKAYSAEAATEADSAGTSAREHYSSRHAGTGPIFTLIRHVIGRGGATNEILCKAFVDAGYPPAMANTTRGRLMKAGEIEEQNGVWVFTTKGEEIATTPVGQMNGHSG
jgi:hypothetical protein